MEKAFIEMDSDADGTVTEAEFVKACLSNRFCAYLFISCVVIFPIPILSISLLAPGFILIPCSLVDRSHTTEILLENSCKAFFLNHWIRLPYQTVFRRFSTMLALKLIDLFTS